MKLGILGTGNGAQTLAGAAAKGTVTGLLRDFGWDDESIVDLGGSRPRAGPSTIS